MDMPAATRTMTRVAVVSCAILAIATNSPVRANDDENVLSAATAAGCRVDAPWAAAVQAWPGAQDAGLKIVATVAGDLTTEYDGELCVGLVRAAGTDFTKEAGLSGAPIRPPAGAEPVSHTYVEIANVPFHFSPTENAFAVRVTEEFNSEPITNKSERAFDNNSEATRYNTTLLYLFRRQGARLVEIFHAKVEDGLLEKTDIFAGEHAHEKIVKFSTHAHQGAYDLILAPGSGGKSETFLWSGTRYVTP